MAKASNKSARSGFVSFTVRISKADVWAPLKKIAARNDRTLASEINHRLRISLANEASAMQASE